MMTHELQPGLRYVVTCREALQLLGIPRDALAPLEQAANIFPRRARKGYSATELQQLRTALEQTKN